MCVRDCDCDTGSPPEVVQYRVHCVFVICLADLDPARYVSRIIGPSQFEISISRTNRTSEELHGTPAPQLGGPETNPGGTAPGRCRMLIKEVNYLSKIAQDL